MIQTVLLLFVCPEVVVQRCSVKKVLLKISQNSHPEACNFIKKETLTQMLSCEFCEIFNNAFVYKTSLVAASGCDKNDDNNRREF